MAPAGPNTDTSTWGEYGGSYSADGRYRWRYEHRIGTGSTVCWIGLCPATGDSAGRARPTLQQMVNRSRKLGMGRILLVNLFSRRCDSFDELKSAADRGIDVIGDECDDRLQQAAAESALTIAAWGAHGDFLDRAEDVVGLVGPLQCYGTTANGQPRQLRGVPRSQPLQTYP